MREFGEGNPDPKASTTLLNWVLWWRVSDEEVQTQVYGYDDFSLLQSARGIAMALLLLSAAVTALFATGAEAPISYGLALFMAVLALLVKFGLRWAIILTMVFWTILKILAVLAPGGIAMALVHALWWAAYMHIFYLALRTEKARARQRATP